MSFGATQRLGLAFDTIALRQNWGYLQGLFGCSCSGFLIRVSTSIPCQVSGLSWVSRESSTLVNKGVTHLLKLIQITRSKRKCPQIERYLMLH